MNLTFGINSLVLKHVPAGARPDRPDKQDQVEHQTQDEEQRAAYYKVLVLLSLDPTLFTNEVSPSFFSLRLIGRGRGTGTRSEAFPTPSP